MLEQVILMGKRSVFDISALLNCCGNYPITADEETNSANCGGKYLKIFVNVVLLNVC